MKYFAIYYNNKFKGMSYSSFKKELHVDETIKTLLSDSSKKKKISDYIR